MPAVEVILLQRVEKLGQMGDKVRVKPGFARNFLLPQQRATRANKANLARFEEQRHHLEAQNLKRRVAWSIRFKFQFNEFKTICDPVRQVNIHLARVPIY